MILERRFIPTDEELEQAYNLLQHKSLGPPTLGQLVLFSQWCRFDPRLAEIWVRFVANEWHQMNPLDWRGLAHEQPWPSVLGVLFEFIVTMLTPHKKRLFIHWAQVITVGSTKGRREQFFIGLRRIGSATMLEDVTHSRREYKKWGYFSREDLVRRGAEHTSSKAARDKVLINLLENTPRLRAGTYWRALNKSVSLRQAERDLKESPRLRAYGNTQGRYYQRKK